MAATIACAQMQPQQPGMGMGASGQMPGTAGEQTPTGQNNAPVDDRTLLKQVHEQLARNNDLNDVEVNVQNGVVTLEGSVPRKQDRKQAKQLAESVPGVRKVNENLKVHPGGASASLGADAAGAGSGESAENAEQQNNTAGSIYGNTSAASGTTTGHSAMGQAGASTSTAPSMNPGTTPAQNGGARNTAITPSQTMTAPPPIAPEGGVAGAVQATPGTAGTGGTSGSVGGNAGAQPGAAGSQPTTASTPGSMNEMAVTPPNNTSLQLELQAAFRQDPRLDGDNIISKVTDDSIDLSGTVSNGKNKQIAKSLAESYAGNRKVVDHLTVRGK
jgi:osmotically-inducible protein OsmY